RLRARPYRSLPARTRTTSDRDRPLARDGGDRSAFVAWPRVQGRDDAEPRSRRMFTGRRDLVLLDHSSAAADLPSAFAQLHRVLRPAGVPLIAFHTGRHVVHADDLWGIQVSLDFYFHAPDSVRRLLEDAGLSIEWDLRREPFGGEVQTQRCYLLARRSLVVLRPATEADREFLRSLHH